MVGDLQVEVVFSYNHQQRYCILMPGQWRLVLHHRACKLQSRPANTFAARPLLQDFACAPRMSRTTPCLQHYTIREGPVRSPAQRVAHGGFPNLAIDVLRHLARPHRLLGRGLSAGGPLPAPRAIAQPLYYLILIPAWDASGCSPPTVSTVGELQASYGISFVQPIQDSSVCRMPLLIDDDILQQAAHQISSTDAPNAAPRVFLADFFASAGFSWGATQ